MSNGQAAFKLVFNSCFKLVLFCQALEGCYSVSNGQAAFKLDQFTVYIFSPNFFTMARVEIGKRHWRWRALNNNGYEQKNEPVIFLPCFSGVLRWAKISLANFSG